MKKPGFVGRFFMYDGVSAITFAVDLLIVWILTQFFGVYYLLSVAFGLVFAVFANYILCREYIFIGASRKFGREYFTSLIIAISAFGAILGLTFLLVDYLQWNYLAARISIGILIGLLNYIAESEFTFKTPFLPRNHKKTC